MKKLFFIVAGVAFFSPLLAHGATGLFLDPAAIRVAVGDNIALTVFFRSDQPVNAYSLVINYPTNLLRFTGDNDSGSIISVWAKPPTDLKGGIVLGGGSLTPFSGPAGKIITLRFTALATGSSSIVFGSNSAIYLANGKGTRVTPVTTGARALISARATTDAHPGDTTDSTPPQITFLALVSDPFERGRTLLSFLVNDEGAGIGATEMRYRTGISWSAWQPAVNPAPISWNTWEVGFRATDNAGNVTEKTIYNIKISSIIWAYCAALLAVALGGILATRKKSKKVQ